jgi:hypothetical protein
MITLSLQYAHQEDTAEERGMASLQQDIDAFRTFPWQDQLAEANKLQLCSPTLFLKDSDDGSVFFVSIMLVNKLDFMLFYEIVEGYEGWTLFGKRKKKKGIIYDSTGHDSKQVEFAIKTYYTERARLRELINPKM